MSLLECPQAENSRLSAIGLAELNQAQQARSKAQTQPHAEIQRSAKLQAKLAASLAVQAQSSQAASATTTWRRSQEESAITEDRLRAELTSLNRTVQHHEAEIADCVNRHQRDKQLAESLAAVSEAHARRGRMHCQCTGFLRRH